MQGKPWAQATPAPKFDLLFQLALADPRGCSYRHVVVLERGEKMKGRGWVLPVDSDKAPRYVIGWNGLIYPVEEVGEEANPREDVLRWVDSGGFDSIPLPANTLSELTYTPEKNPEPRMMMPTAAKFLLARAGLFHIDTLDIKLEEVLPRLASESLADGAVAALDRRDVLASWRLQSFKKLQAEIDKLTWREEPSLPIDPSDPFAVASSGGDGSPVFDANLISFLKDSCRRLEPPERLGASQLESDLAAWADLEEWDVEAPPEVFERIVAQGETAIMLLLHVLEADERWTLIRRIINAYYSEEAAHTVQLVRTKDLAILALERILDFPVTNLEIGRSVREAGWYAETSAKLSAFCHRYNHTSRGELWFRILEDGEATLDDQLAAGIRLVYGEAFNPLGLGAFYFDREAAYNLFCAPVVSPEGRALRSRRDPSVADLLEKAWHRAREEADLVVAKGAAEMNFSSFPCAAPTSLRDQAQLFLRLMEVWKPGNVELLREHYEWLSSALVQRRGKAGNGDSRPEGHLMEFSEEVLIRRFWSKDPTVMADFAKLLRSSEVADDIPHQFMAECAEGEEMENFIHDTFLGEKALVNLGKSPWSWGHERILDNRDLMISPAYREAVVAALKNTERYGAFQWNGDIVELAFTDTTYSIHLGSRKDFPEEGPPIVDLRFCDLVARALTPTYGKERVFTPSFNLYAPVAERDRVIALWIGILSPPEE